MKTKYLIKKILRKIYHFIGFISLFIIFLTPVKADTYVFNVTNNHAQNISSDTYNYIYDTLIPSHSSEYNNYFITQGFYSNPVSSIIYVNFFNSSQSDYLDENINSSSIRYYINNSFLQCYSDISSTSFTCHLVNDSIKSFSIYTYQQYTYFDSSFNLTSHSSYIFSNFYSDDILVEPNSFFPKLKDLYNFSSFSDFQSNFNYIEVNLDNYEYVLLSLKNYNETSAFQTNLQVKGQIGITPIYNYGQTSKDTITGSQVQDRCNLTYSDYTSYPFYILQSDLQNNVIYAVKSCSSNSSFKFDNSIFDITYITQENKDNPTVTIGGKTYNVIPYDDLPSTATKNEIDNYIPGESGGATSTGGLNSAIKNTQQKLSELWDTFTYFTSFISQIFSTLPDPMQTILLSAFTISIIIGLIKLFTN